MRGRARLEASADDRRRQVRERYGTLASGGNPSVPPAPGSRYGEGAGSSCCGDASSSVQLGYTSEQLESLPEGANLGLGCGHPTAILALKSGQTVLDMGSGAGIDCFLAAKKVGSKGSVIGVDMTPQMLSKSRENALKGGYKNVEFRLGEIEHLPVANNTVDVVISNCVINLAPEKGQVYREAFRVLRPGGRLAVSDVVATRPITKKERADPTLWSTCSSGALDVKKVKSLLKKAGFADIRVDLNSTGAPPGSLKGQASIGVVSADIQARKPRA